MLPPPATSAHRSTITRPRRHVTAQLASAPVQTGLDYCLGRQLLTAMNSAPIAGWYLTSSWVTMWPRHWCSLIGHQLNFAFVTFSTFWCIRWSAVVRRHNWKKCWPLLPTFYRELHCDQRFAETCSSRQRELNSARGRFQFLASGFLNDMSTELEIYRSTFDFKRKLETVLFDKFFGNTWAPSVVLTLCYGTVCR